MKIKEGTAAAIFIIVAAWLSFWFLYEGEQRLEVSFLDIGQGDAALIETPNNKTILVDGGPPDKAVLRELGRSLPFWQRRIDLVILSHPHDDHFGGLTAVAERYSIGAVILSDFPYNTPPYQEFIVTLKNKKIPIVYAKQEDITVDGVILNFIFPSDSLAESKIENPNNASLVFRLSYGEVDILFTGDAETELETELLKISKAELSAEILKLGHHGSDTSSTEAFLDTVNPELAIASAGNDNSYGHPSPRILRRLERRGIKSYRTDQDGTIRLKIDGRSVFKNKACIIGCS